jgi:hypothetical protein
MAKVILYEGDNITNLDMKVGVKGSNAPNDVVVVQAMLKYITQFTIKWTGANIPEPNGFLDRNTQQAIFDYQDHVRSTVGNPYEWVARDGSISPYNENVALLRKQAWTIIKMNNDCGSICAGKRDGYDYIDALCRRWPQVARVLGRNPAFL